MTVKTNAKEFATGTAMVMLQVCKVHTYKTLPDWLIKNGIQYFKRKATTFNSRQIFLVEDSVLIFSIPLLPILMKGFVQPHKTPTAIKDTLEKINMYHLIFQNVATYQWKTTYVIIFCIHTCTNTYVCMWLLFGFQAKRKN